MILTINSLFKSIIFRFPVDTSLLQVFSTGRQYRFLLSAAISFAAVSLAGGCDSDSSDSTNRDAGVRDVMSEEDGAAREPYTVVIINDVSLDSPMGTSGADICGITARCGDELRVGTMARVWIGSGAVCEEPGDFIYLAGTTKEEDYTCITSRNNADAALDDGISCAIDSNPADYVSLGYGGNLAVWFDGDLRGCTIEVSELVDVSQQQSDREGETREAYVVYVCAVPPDEPEGTNLVGRIDLDRCAGGDNIGRFVEFGGTSQAVVPEI